MKHSTIAKTIKRLIEEGEMVLSTQFDAGVQGVHYMGGRPRGVEITPFAKFQAGCVNLVRLLGDAGEPFAKNFDGNNDPVNVEQMVGTLQAIKEAVDDNLLLSVEDLIRAETFNGLLDQSDYLLDKNYYLAAGVLGRAVLEEHLRTLCDARGCMPSKPKPTVNDYKDELYKNKDINLTEMKHVESLAAVGNNAAHNKPELTQSDVDRLLRDVRDFLLRNPVA